MLMLLTGKPTAGRGNSPREERATEPCFRLNCTDYTVPPNKADQCKAICPRPKLVAGSIIMEIMAITLPQLLKLQSNHAEILSQQE